MRPNIFFQATFTFQDFIAIIKLLKPIACVGSAEQIKRRGEESAKQTKHLPIWQSDRLEFWIQAVW